MGVLYGKNGTQWEPIITALSSGGMTWPIQTVDPPLIIESDGTNADVGNQLDSKPEAYIEMNKFEYLAGATMDDPDAIASGKWYKPRVLAWHPASEFGPFWTYNSPGGVGAPNPYLRDVNPDHDYAGISSDWTGQLFISPAEAIWYSTTPGKDQLTKPPGGYVPYDQVWQYNMDAHWHFDHMYFGFGSLEIEHWQDVLRGYPTQDGTMPDDQVWDAHIVDLWLGSGAYFEMFTDSFGDHERNDVEVMSSIWGYAYCGDITSDPRRPEVTLWARWEEGRPGHEDEYQEDLMQREVHFTSHHMHLYSGPINRGLPDGQLNRGNIPVLAAVQGVMGTLDAPQLKQYYRQIGQQNVVFTDGVGHVVFPEEIWTGEVHPQAVVVGSAAGPMIAQVDRSGDQLRFYLNNDTFDGTLAVSWSVDYQEPVWSLTRPVIGYVYVFGDLTGADGVLRPENTYFMHDGVAILIPYDAAGGEVELRFSGYSYNPSLIFEDLDGNTPGTVYNVSWGTAGQNSFHWNVARDLYPVGQGATFRVVNPDGQFSNAVELRWADIPLPTTIP